MSVEWLGHSGFSDYWIPGLILFTTLGMLPLVGVLLLWLRPEWGLMRSLEDLFHIHWVWGVAFGVGLAQMIWIAYQVTTMGPLFWLQPTMFTVGLLIVGLCLLPSVRRYYGFGLGACSRLSKPWEVGLTRVGCFPTRLVVHSTRLRFAESGLRFSTRPGLLKPRRPMGLNSWYNYTICAIPMPL